MKKTKNTESTKVPTQTNPGTCEICLGDQHITYMHGQEERDMPCPLCNDKTDPEAERLMNGWPFK